MCGKHIRAVYDRRRRSWRHLDLGRNRLWLVYEIRRLHCPECGVGTEELPWARPKARHTRDTVTTIINRGVAELLDQRRPQTLYRIGVDEICYRHPTAI